MDGLSVIIPTMWKSNLIFDTIDQVVDMDENIEIIIIDNNYNPISFSSSKVKKLNQETNIFVNPAWNLGVQEAKYNHIILHNDDILCNLKVFYNSYFKFIKKESNCGLISFWPTDLSLNAPLNRDGDVIEFKKNKDRVRWNGFGMFMAMPKKNYFFIPDELKVFFGDDLQNIWNILNGRESFGSYDLKFRGEYSRTVNSIELGLDEQYQEKLYGEIVQKIQSLTR